MTDEPTTECLCSPVIRSGFRFARHRDTSLTGWRYGPGVSSSPRRVSS